MINQRKYFDESFFLLSMMLQVWTGEKEIAFFCRFPQKPEKWINIFSTVNSCIIVPKKQSSIKYYFDISIF